MRPIPIHVTFKLGDRHYAVPCKDINQARELRDKAAYSDKLSYARINKSGRFLDDVKRISVDLFVKLY